jgi:hypothetical protein
MTPKGKKSSPYLYLSDQVPNSYRIGIPELPSLVSSPSMRLRSSIDRSSRPRVAHTDRAPPRRIRGRYAPRIFSRDATPHNPSRSQWPRGRWMRRRHHPSSASGQASDDVQQHFRENVSHATRVGRTFAATGAQIRRALRRRPRPRSPYDAIPLFGRSCSSSLHQRWVCEHGARSLSEPGMTMSRVRIR